MSSLELATLHPALILLAAAVLVPFLRGWLRGAVLLAAPSLALFHVLTQLSGDALVTIPFCGQTLTVLRVDETSHVFGVLFNMAAFVGVVYSLHLKDALQQTASLLYAASALGVVYAGDLITLFVSWELLAVTSTAFIWARRSRHSGATGNRYLMLQLSSGLMLLSGILILIHVQEQAVAAGALESVSIAFDHIGLKDLLLVGSNTLDPTQNDMIQTARWLIFLGFGLKCGFPLMHTWLTDGYPAATITGTVFLSGFTTKVAIYALVRAFTGAEELVWIGAAMALFPIFYAVIENDLRRVLSFSMINQLGFMVVGIGIGSNIGVNGAIAHAFNDVFFKGLMFMTMGAVLLRTGTTKGSELGGLYKSMPWTTSLCLVGAASISAIPLFSGFVSKTMIVIAVVQESQLPGSTEFYHVLWWLLMFASAGVVEHAGIKIPFFAFFAHDSGKRVREAPPNMLIAMTLAAIVCVVNGCYPQLLFDLLPREMESGFTVFSKYKVIVQLQLLAFACLSVVFLMRSGLYPPEIRSVNLDFDWVYRKGAAPLRWLFASPLAYLARGFQRLVLEILPGTVRDTADNDFRLRLPRRWQLELSVLMVILLLLSYLLYNYIL